MRLSIRGRLRPDRVISYTGERLPRPLPSPPAPGSSNACRLKLLPKVGARSLFAPVDEEVIPVSMSFRLALLISPSAVDVRTPRVSHTTAPGLDITASRRRMWVWRSSRLWMSSAYRRGRRIRWRFNCDSSCASSRISGHASLSRSNTFTVTCSFVARGTAADVIAQKAR